MRKLSIVALLSTAMLAPQALADQLEIGLNEETASLDWITPVTRETELQLGYLYSEPAGSLADLSLHVNHDSGIHHLALGGQLATLFADERDNGVALAVGGRYRMALNDLVGISVQGYYAPSVLAFDDLEQYHSLESRLEFTPMPNADLFVGYRHVKFHFEQEPSLTFESGLYVGAAFRF